MTTPASSFQLPLSRLQPLGTHGWWLWRERGPKRRFSPIVLRILAVNIMALAILVGSLLYLGRYQDRLIAAELDALFMQASLSANAISEGAVVIDENENNILSPLLARLMTRRLSEAMMSSRVRLYDLDETLLADSRILTERSDKIQVEELPPATENYNWVVERIMDLFDALDRVTKQRNYPAYSEQLKRQPNPYEIVGKALQGERANEVWTYGTDGLVLAVTVPVQRTKQVMGAVMVSRPDNKVAAAVREVRFDILKIFGITLLVTILLSLYLARAIARPVRQLAMAADIVRSGQTGNSRGGIAQLLDPNVIPDLSARQDEIGDLSVALRDMTGALAQRIGAIENFAADVAHEIKNPLTSLRSAVETAERVKDPAQQAKLMLIIRDDVDRMDRLISDIANASRLDAELSRAEAAPLKISAMLTMLADLYALPQDESEGAPVVQIKTMPDEALTVLGVEVRLVQVMQNLIANALSFSPPHGHVWLSAISEGRSVVITVEDEGPGIPDNKLDAIFDRFYSERPKAEKFGQHSGLGLSISKQIVEAHRGTIHAENRRNEQGEIIGARFVIRLPATAR